MNQKLLIKFIIVLVSQRSVLKNTHGLFGEVYLFFLLKLRTNSTIFSQKSVILLKIDNPLLTVNNRSRTMNFQFYLSLKNVSQFDRYLCLRGTVKAENLTMAFRLMAIQTYLTQITIYKKSLMKLSYLNFNLLNYLEICFA